jgi:hypothetical protein
VADSRSCLCERVPSAHLYAGVSISIRWRDANHAPRVPRLGRRLRRLLADLGLILWPGWTPHWLSLALQAALDGFLLRYRIMPDDYPTSRWEGAGIVADTVLAVIFGVIDTDRSGTNGREALK